jgi:hypothetical protein
MPRDPDMKSAGTRLGYHCSVAPGFAYSHHECLLLAYCLAGLQHDPTHLFTGEIKIHIYFRSWQAALQHNRSEATDKLTYKLKFYMYTNLQIRDYEYTAMSR